MCSLWTLTTIENLHKIRVSMALETLFPNDTG